MNTSSDFDSEVSRIDWRWDTANQSMILAYINRFWINNKTASLPEFIANVFNDWGDFEAEVLRVHETNDFAKAIRTLRVQVAQLDADNKIIESHFTNLKLELQRRFIEASEELEEFVYGSRRTGLHSSGTFQEQRLSLLVFLVMVEALPHLKFDKASQTWQSKAMDDRNSGTDSTATERDNYQYLRLDGSTYDDTHLPILEWILAKDEKTQGLICREWISRVDELMTKWPSGELGDVETVAWARTLYSAGVDCCDVSDRNIKSMGDNSGEWKTILLESNSSLKTLFLIFGAMAHLKSDLGEESSVKARRAAIQEAHGVNRRLDAIGSPDPS